MRMKSKALGLIVVMLVGAGNLPRTNAQESEVRTAKLEVENELQALVDKVYPAFVLISGGSGVCISPDGYMITNHHVAPSAVSRYDADGNLVEIPVRMAGNGKHLTARPIGGDPRGDIVMLKIESEEPLPYVELADSDEVRIGDIAVAVGNPFLLSGSGAEPSVSLGVVSVCDRYQGGYSECFQVDAPVNPGNSGGPSFNIKGEVIGINGRILTRHGQRYNTGAGFVITANQIKRFIDVFKEQPGGSIIVRHGLISGLALFHSDEDDWCEVMDVAEHSTAAKAGIQPGDIISEIEGYHIDGWRSFYGKLCTWPLGSEVELFVERIGEGKTFHTKIRLDVPVTLNQMPMLPHVDDDEEEAFIFKGAGSEANMPSMFAIPAPSVSLNLRLASTKRAEGGFKFLGYAQDMAISPNAAPRELESGDIITHLAGRPIKYMAEIRDCLLGYKAGDTVTLTYKRDGTVAKTEVTLE